MSIFVDNVGLNTVISSSLDLDTNTISSGENREIVELKSRNDVTFAPSKPDPAHEHLVGINIHRNGPYGFSSWKQLRVSDNPITRYHKKTNTMTFVVQPGPLRNILANGEFRVRDRSSIIYNFNEPIMTQKSYPLIWNVGTHFKDEDGNIDFQNPYRYSILSSYGNGKIGFANKRVDELLKYSTENIKQEYETIKNAYLDGGLDKIDTDITHWEFLQYRETVFPHMKNQFKRNTLTRPSFLSFFRHVRANRNKIISNDIGLGTGVSTPFGNKATDLSQSQWPLDAGNDFISLSKVNPSNISDANRKSRSAGSLLSMYNLFREGLSTTDLLSSDPATLATAINDLDDKFTPGPIYSRRITLMGTGSVSNPTGMVIPETSNMSATGNVLFEGAALWEAGATRTVKDEDGNYVSSSREPFYDTYDHYAVEVRKKYKNFSVVPEFRISENLEDYLTNNLAIENDMLEVTGGVSGSDDSSTSQFYEIYSNSDFLSQFDLISTDHKDFVNGKVLSLRCKVAKKFLPYEGFYPAQRTVDLAKRFYDSFNENISIKQRDPTKFDGSGLQIDGFNFGKQLTMTPLFAPGVLFNTIKSGVAVDYPIFTGSVFPLQGGNFIAGTTGIYEDEYIIGNGEFDFRVPFEALIEPQRHLAGLNITCQEPHPSGNLSVAAIWDGQGDELYSKMANNFFAAVPDFFLPDGQFTSLVSKKQSDIVLENGKSYGMRIKMRRTMDAPKSKVYNRLQPTFPYFPPQDVFTGSLARENFTMYSRPSAFGPPSLGSNQFNGNLVPTDAQLHMFGIPNRFLLHSSSAEDPVVNMDSVTGYNFPFTPPYYHGEGWCDITFTANSDSMTIAQIQDAAVYDFTRFDGSFIQLDEDGSAGFSFAGGGSRGPQSFRMFPGSADGLSRFGISNKLDKNAVQLSASLNIRGIGVAKSSRKENTSLVVDTAVDEESRWIIQTKFETPMLNFNHVSTANGNLTVPRHASESVPRGMWHQYGRIPKEDEGVFLEVGPIPQNYRIAHLSVSGGVAAVPRPLEDLSEVLGFSGASTKIGRVRSSKTVYEAVVAVPFVEKAGEKKFFLVDKNMVTKYKQGGAARASLTSGDPQGQIGRSLLNQLEKMEKYVFPPSFDFINFSEDDVEPIAMYIFEFSHTFTQQDLADIWQNLPPDIGITMEESEVAITHPILKKELLGPGGRKGNTLIDVPDKLKWMVFKVKQRAPSNYFKKTVIRNPQINTDSEFSNVTVDEFGDTSKIQYNWPYDYFSLVELVRLDAEVEFGTFNQSDIDNYTSAIPPYQDRQADTRKIFYIAGGGVDESILEDLPIPSTVDDNPFENLADSTGVGGGGSFTVGAGTANTAPTPPEEDDDSGLIDQIGMLGRTDVSNPEVSARGFVLPAGSITPEGSSSGPTAEDLKRDWILNFDFEYRRVSVLSTKRQRLRRANRRATSNVREKYDYIEGIDRFKGKYFDHPETGAEAVFYNIPHGALDE